MARSGPKLTRIANTLGVSAATVSNALSGKGRVSAELTDRIRSIAADLGYVPSQAGRALRTGRSGVIGLVLPDISNPLFPQIAQAIEFAASSAGYGVLIADSRGDIAIQTRAIERLIERGVDGMVIVQGAAPASPMSAARLRSWTPRPRLAIRWPRTIGTAEGR